MGAQKIKLGNGSPESQPGKWDPRKSNWQMGAQAPHWEIEAKAIKMQKAKDGSTQKDNPPENMAPANMKRYHTGHAQHLKPKNILANSIISAGF